MLLTKIPEGLSYSIRGESMCIDGIQEPILTIYFKNKTIPFSFNGDMLSKENIPYDINEISNWIKENKRRLYSMWERWDD